VNPDLLRFVPGSEFVPYASVDPQIVTPEPSEPRRGPIRIVHAPTNREIKGTEHVLAAVERLRGRHDVELRLVEGLPHAEAMQLYRDADLVIDQLRIGWYGGFAVEAMAMGKPVVCHIADEDLELVPEAMRRALPIVRATPESLPDVLDDLLRHEELLPDIGRLSREYVEAWHDPLEIARRMLAVYADPNRRFWDAD
jgi:glycosyltransferase involved in cell wall biosynthesis